MGSGACPGWPLPAQESLKEPGATVKERSRAEAEVAEGADELWKRRRRNIDKYITGRSCLTPGDNDDVLMRLCTPTLNDAWGICRGVHKECGF